MAIDLNSATQIGGSGGTRYTDKSGATFVLESGKSSQDPASYTPTSGVGTPTTGGGSTIPKYTPPTGVLPPSTAPEDKSYLTQDEESAIRERTRKEMQARIDSTNEVYNRLVDEETQKGVGREGSARALAARGGVLGQDIGLGYKEEAQATTSRAKSLIEAKRNESIQALFGEADKQAQARIDTENKRNELQHTEYLAAVEKQNADAKQLINDFGAQGNTWDMLDKTTQDNLLKTSGMSATSAALAMESSLLKSHPELAPKTTDIQSSDASGNAVIHHVSYNPRTGQQTSYDIPLGIPASGMDPSFKPVSLGDGRYIYKDRSGKLQEGGSLDALKSAQAEYYKARAKALAETKPGNKLTLSEAKNLKLPVSMVGLSEQDIANGLSSPTPPDWYINAIKEQNPNMGSLDPNGIQQSWDTTRKSLLTEQGTFGGTTTPEQELQDLQTQFQDYADAGYTKDEVKAQYLADTKLTELPKPVQDLLDNATWQDSTSDTGGGFFSKIGSFFSGGQ